MKYHLTLVIVCVTALSTITLANNGPKTGGPSEFEPTTANPSPQPPSCPKNCYEAPDPVVLSGGKLYYPAVDVNIPGLGRAFGLNLQFFRAYSSQSNEIGVLGQGWSTTLDIYLGNAGGAAPRFYDATGEILYFTQSSTVLFPDGGSRPGWQHGRSTLEANGNGYMLINGRGIKSRFTAVGELSYQEDPSGNRITYNRNTLRQVTSLTDASGRCLYFTYLTSGKMDSVRDPLGRVWGYGYSAAGNLQGVKGPSPLFLTEYYYYDANHNIVSVVNPRGKATVYNYDYTNDRVTRMTHPDGTHVDFTYGNYLGSSTMTDEDGNCWTYEYVDVGLVSNIIDPLNHTRHYGYNSSHELTDFSDSVYQMTYTWDNHNLTQITDWSGAVKVYTYDPNNHELLSREDDNHHIVSMEKDPSLRRVGRTFDGRGKFTVFSYYPSGLLQTVTDRNGKTTTLTYDAHGNIVQIDDAAGKPWQFTYDAAGRVLTKKDPLLHVTTTDYDVADRVTRVTRHDTTHFDYTYDANGNRLSAVDPLGHPTTYTYDDRDRRITRKDALLNTVTFNYNGRSLLVYVKDPINRTTSYSYDSARRRILTTEVLGGVPFVTQFFYNDANELVQLTDAANHATHFAWNPSLKQRTTTFHDTTTEIEQFDGAGNLVNYTNRSGASTTASYDENDRLTTQTCAECGASFVYDEEGNLINAADAKAGANLLSDYVWTYNSLNQVLTSKQPGGTTGGAKTVTYTYDDAARLLSLKYPDNTLLTYGYDALNRETSITTGASIYSFTYDAAGRRTAQTFPTAYYYNSHGSFSFDIADRQTGSDWGWYMSSYASQSYVYNNASEITSTTASNGLSGTRSYTYDDFRRLTGRTTTGALNAPYSNLTWNFDLVGNRVSTVGATTVGYSLKTNVLNNGVNEYNVVGGVALNYDSRGNLTGDGTRTMSYDADNRLMQVVTGGTTVDYTYDFAHRLAKRVTSGGSTSNNRYIYDQNWNVLADLNGADGTTLIKYIHGPGIDEVLAQVGASAATTYYLFKDNLGSTTVAVRSSDEAVVQRYTYDEYGAVQVRDSAGTPVSSPPLTRYLFTGREFDVTTGLFNYRHRVYHPGLGRFLQPDPIGFEGGDVDFYNYVGNHPLSHRDPDGEFGLVAALCIAVATGLIISGMIIEMIEEHSKPHDPAEDPDCKAPRTPFKTRPNGARPGGWARTEIEAP